MIAPTYSQPPNNPDALTLAQAPAPQVDLDRKREMHEAWKAYRGQFQKPLKVKKDQPDDNILSNRCAPIVDKGVSFLFGQIVKIEVPDEQDQAYLAELFGDDDDMMTLFSKMSHNGGVCGHNFAKVIPATGNMQYPRVIPLDPQIIRTVTLPDDCEIPLAYIIEYPSWNEWQKRQIIARVDPNSDISTAGPEDLEDTWLIANYVRKGSSGTWIQKGDVIEWDYPFPPIIDNQNLPNPNEFWGTPDLTPDLIGMNKAIIFVLSNLARILKFHGHPKTWIKGANASQIQTGVDDILVLQSTEAEVGNLEMTSSLADFLSLLADLRADMDEQSRVPAVALGRLADLPKGNISGVALQLLFQPLLEKTILKQRLYGAAIRQLVRVLLVLAGRLAATQMAKYQVKLHWQNLLPVDDLAAAQTAQILQAIGVSDDTLMQQLGYNADDEAEKSAKEDQAKMTAFSRGQGFPPQAQPGQDAQQDQAAQQKAEENKP